MSGSRFAYPLVRGIDGDSGGAAELQTDVMRFMAILSLCLVAIFALVQSLPIAPETVPDSMAAPAEDEPAPAKMSAPGKAALAPRPEPIETAAKTRTSPPAVRRSAVAPPERVVLTRPAAAAPATEPTAARQDDRATAPSPPAPNESGIPDGFTLRFESDLALTRLVASGQVGFFAVATGRAQRMSVGNSRISFWDASTPAAYHQMDAATVPASVVDALSRTGTDPGSVDWGVTLPGRLRSQLAAQMREHAGGELVIGANGNLALEKSATPESAGERS